MSLFINEVSVFQSSGRDEILIRLDDKTAYTVSIYNTTVKIETSGGLGEKWCKKYIGIEPKIIYQTKGIIQEGEDLDNRKIELDFREWHTLDKFDRMYHHSKTE